LSASCQAPMTVALTQRCRDGYEGGRVDERGTLAGFFENPVTFDGITGAGPTSSEWVRGRGGRKAPDVRRIFDDFGSGRARFGELNRV
jgi:hypothetical protein